MSKKPNNKDNDFLSPEELAFAEEYDKHHDNTVVHTNDDAQAWAKKLLGESNNTTTNNPTTNNPTTNNPTTNNPTDKA